MSRVLTDEMTAQQMWVLHQLDEPECHGPVVFQLTDRGFICPVCGWECVDAEEQRPHR